MSLGWNDVIGHLLLTVETWPGRAMLEKICVIRDLQGRVRMAVQPRKGAMLDWGGLQTTIGETLGRWFASPILFTEDPSSTEERRLARNLIARLQARWPQTWPHEYRDLVGIMHPVTTGSGGSWCGEQRARSKDVWLQQGRVDVPWPLGPRTPAIVSFYSFKGGVGRTTTLGIVARQLARHGKHVVVIDLDLEAPGLGRLFDIRTERGVLDLLVEFAATKRLEVDDGGTCWSTLSNDSGRITVYPVGTLDGSYIERLACLDYASRPNDGQSAVEAALRSILRQVKIVHAPDFILLDARAGLHDLGGLSLHALAHLDVLVGRAGSATSEGFRLVLDALARRRHERDLRVIMVQSFLPAERGEQVRAREAWTETLYELFEETIYAQLYPDELPAVEDDTAMHFPWSIPYYEGIARADRLEDIDESFLNAEAYARLANRLVERVDRPPLGSDLGHEHEEEEVDSGND
jgi:cellulose biosynthesis protein BcsQ